MNPALSNAAPRQWVRSARGPRQRADHGPAEDQRRHQLAGVVAEQTPRGGDARPQIGHGATAVQRVPQTEEGQRLEAQDLRVGDADAAEVDGGAADREQQGADPGRTRREQLAGEQVGGEHAQRAEERRRQAQRPDV